MCHWSGETTDPPDQQLMPPETCSYQQEIAGGKDNIDFDYEHEERLDFDLGMCRFDSGDPNVVITFERWWEGLAGCTYPCPDSDVHWTVIDSVGTTVFESFDRYPVNTYGNPDILYGTYNGVDWKVIVENSCGCMINEDWELSVSANGVR